MSKTISARIDDTLHSMITDEANQAGKTVNESLKEVLNNHFNGEEKKEISQSEAIMDLSQNQKNQDEKIEGIEKYIRKLTDLVTENQTRIIQAINNRMNDHESKYTHEKEFHSSLRCNSS